MLVGHCAVAFAGKRIEPKLSLGTLMAASVLADLLGFIFILLGIEHWKFNPGESGIFAADLDNVAWSHGLFPDILWAALLGGGYYLWRRQERGAWILAAAVVSHWLLDFASHRPDMPLGPGFRAYYGLGLWTSIPATLVVEGSLWVIALTIYVRATRSSRWPGIYLFWAMIGFLTLSWISNIATVPQVPSARAAGVASLIFFTLLVLWAYWMDRVRKPDAAIEPR